MTLFRETTVRPVLARGEWCRDRDVFVLGCPLCAAPCSVPAAEVLADGTVPAVSCSCGFGDAARLLSRLPA